MARHFLLPLLLWLAAMPARALDIPLTVEEPAGVARQAAPVSSGLCLPPRACRAGQRFSLFEGQREVPLQTTPLVVDRDGFLRWVLLDFHVGAGAGETKRLVLRTEAGRAQPAQAIRVTDTPEAVAVDTGALAFRVGKTKPFALLDEVRVRGQRVAGGGAVKFVEAKSGARCRAGRPERVALEYQGPLRVTLRVDGAHQPEGAGDCRLRYTTRITAWAGRTDLRVQHILANSNPEQVHHVNLRGASLSLRHALGAEAEASVGAGGASGKPGAGQAVWLHQGKQNRYYNSPIADGGGGKVARYQVKCAELPIVAYDDFDLARDQGAKRNFWRAANMAGEPQPAVPGAREEFGVTGVPEGARLYFAVVSYDDSGNRSGLSNVAE